MPERLKAFFNVRSGEAAPVALTFLYIMTVLASYLLAKSIRNGLFLREFGAYKLAYVYVGVPIALTLFVPVYVRIAARLGQRTVITGSLVFFLSNVLVFWYLFTYQRTPMLSAIFYIWVNAFGIIAPVQVWTFANAIFDTRQAKRLFGLIGAGASAGAILGGKLANVLVGPVGGTVNLLLVFAGLIAAAAVMVNVAWQAVPTKGARAMGGQRAVPFGETLRLIAGTRYLATIAMLVVLTAIVTQWTQFQLSLVAEARFGRDADRLTAFYGDLNFYLGIVAFLLQIFGTGVALRTLGLAITILLLPASLAAGSALVVIFPAFWAVLLTNVCDQSLRFSVDKASFELLYLPVADAVKTNVKATIDIIINRVADAIGGVMLGVATQGFVMLFIRLPGLGLALTGTALIVLALIALWLGAAVAARRGYVQAIRASIEQHRLGAEQAARAASDRSVRDLIAIRLGSADPREVVYALDAIAAQRPFDPQPAARLIGHVSADVRARAIAALREHGDTTHGAQVESLLRDPDVGVRTEALLYLSQAGGFDPLMRVEALGDFADFSIRAGMVACLAQPGRAQNLDAARLLLDAMVNESGPAGRRTRLEAARLLSRLPAGFEAPHARLLDDDDPEVVRQAVRAVLALGRRELLPLVLPHAGHELIAADVVEAVTALGTESVASALTESLLETDPDRRGRIIKALNKLTRRHPDLRIDGQVVETILAAEIMGHYRSYQVLGTLGGSIDDQSPAVAGLRASMAREVERIFRLMSLRFPEHDLHSAHAGLEAENPAVRANAIEFLDNILKPEIRSLVVPLFDGQVSIAERVRLARRFVGAEAPTPAQAVAILAASPDPWTRSCAAYAIGALSLTALAPDLERWTADPDPALRDAARRALETLRNAERLESSMPDKTWSGV